MDIKIKDFEGPWTSCSTWSLNTRWIFMRSPWLRWSNSILAYLATLQAMKLEVVGEYMLMASQLTWSRVEDFFPKVAERWMKQRISSRTSFSIGRVPYSQAIRRVDGLTARGARLYYSKPKMELVYDDTELLHDRQRWIFFLAFSKLLTKKKEEFHRTIRPL